MEFGWTLVSLLVMVTVVTSQEQEVVSIEYSMFEEAPQFTFVGNIGTDILNTDLVDDLTTEQRSGLTFSTLGDGSSGDYFNIDSDSGVLRTDRRIDREVICPQQEECSILLNIGVLTTGFFSELNVQITIDDLNDNPPRFLESSISKSIPENTDMGTSFSIPTADDLDSPRYSIVNYQLLSPSDEFELKVSDDLGSMYLVLIKELDREQIASFSLVVAAYDGGQEAKTGTLTIDITVLDVNDNRPKFLNETYAVSVPENQAVNSIVLRVQAMDSDLGANGQLSYGFTTRTNSNFGTTFSINNKTGDIYLRQELDFERTQVYVLVVTASENNAESIPVEAKVTIHVSDINDLRPQITVNALTTNRKIQISESDPVGTYVAHIKVTDPDLGPSGEFTCNLEQTVEVVDVQKRPNGAYTLTTSTVLDRELHSEYMLNFVCADNGSPSLTSSAEIVVKILDENDNRPEFKHQSYNVDLNENNYPGRFLTKLSATDADSGENGEIEFVLPPLSQRYLRLDPLTGNITARVAFDHEQDPDLSLPVFAVDKGDPPLTATATININVHDLNDEAPKFTLDKYTFQITESDVIGQEVGQVNAQDPDSDSVFTYSISSETAEPARSSFTIEPETGAIFTRIRLDREQNTDYVLLIKATDSEDSSLFTTSTVSIYVSDVNDNFPVITYPSPKNNSITLSRSVFRGRIVMNIRAHDLDSGSNGRLTYSISSGNDQGLFEVDKNTGVMTLSPDVETIPAQTYHLIITVQDNGSPAKTSDANLDIVADETLTAEGAGQLIIGGNLAIVVSVAVISFVLTLVLVIAIILMCNRQGKKNHLSTLLRSPSKDSEDHVDHKKRKEVSFSNDVEITDETGPPNPYLQQKPTYSSGPAHKEYSRHSPSKKPCSVHGNQNDMQLQYTAATQNNYLTMPRASKDSDSAHSEDSTNTDSGRGSDTTEHNAEYKGASRHHHRHLGPVLESPRPYLDDQASTSSSSYPQQLGGPLPLPPRAPTSRDPVSPYRPPRKPQQQPQYQRATSWNNDAVQLDDEVFTLTPSHV